LVQFKQNLIDTDLLDYYHIMHPYRYAKKILATLAMSYVQTLGK